MTITIDYIKNSEMLKALGHPVRLKMVNGLLQGDGCNVNEIVEKFNLPQSTISQHLKILKINNIISYHKNGVKTCYKICDKKIIKIINLLKE